MLLPNSPQFPVCQYARSFEFVTFVPRSMIVVVGFKAAMQVTCAKSSKNHYNILTRGSFFPNWGHLMCDMLSRLCPDDAASRVDCIVTLNEASYRI